MKLRMPTSSQVGHFFTDPVVRTRQYFVDLVGAFGWRFVVMVMFGEHLLKGFLAGGGTSGFFVIESRCYMAMGIGAMERTTMTAISGSPWSLKPIMGMISDTLIIRTKRRVQWVILTALLALACYSLVMAMGRSIPSMLLAMCFFFGRLQCAWTDLMVESCYTAKMRVAPEHSSDILTWVWGGIGVFSIFAYIIVGSCLDVIGPFTSVAIPLSLCGLVIIPAALGWLEETPCTTPSCGIRREVITEQRPYFLTAIVLAIAVLVSLGCAVAKVDQLYLLIVAVVDSVAVFSAAIYFLPSILWGPMLYMFLNNALTIQTYTFVDNFYLDPATAEESAKTGYPICYDCPHFDNYFYTTVVGVVDAICTTIGSWIFNAVISKWKYRKALVVTQVIVMVTSIFDIIQFQRWNRDIGIPDWVFMLGKSALQNTCSMLNFLPLTILTSKLCPVGMESTVFALLAGFSNYGSTVSQYVGAYVVNGIGLGNIGSGTVDDFSHAWIACVINACTPLLVLLTLPWLIPNAYMTDNLEKLAKGTDFAQDAKDGSSSSQLEGLEAGNELLETDLEAVEYVAGLPPAPLPTPVLALQQDEHAAGQHRLVGEDTLPAVEMY